MIVNEKLSNKLQKDIKAHDELLQEIYKRSISMEFLTRASALGYSEAKTFSGYRPGYVFKMDELGLGYYRDNTESGNVAFFLAQAQVDDDDL